MKYKIAIVGGLSVVLMSGCTGCQEQKGPPPPINNEKKPSILFFETVNDSLLYSDGSRALMGLCGDQEAKGVSVELLKFYVEIPNVDLESLQQSVPEGQDPIKYSVEFAAHRGDYTELYSRLYLGDRKITQGAHIYNETSRLNQDFCLRVPDDVRANYESKTTLIDAPSQNIIPNLPEHEPIDPELVKPESFPLESIQELPPQDQQALQQELQQYVEEELGITSDMADTLSPRQQKEMQEKIMQKWNELLQK